MKLDRLVSILVLLLRRDRVQAKELVIDLSPWGATELYAWCHIRQDFRLFKLSRIRELAATDICYKPKKVSMGELIREDQWKDPENRISLELVFEKQMESIVTEWFGEELERQQDERLRVIAVLPENNWLYGFILLISEGYLQTAEAPFTAYYNMDMENLDVEIGFPVSKQLAGKGEIKAGEIPAGKYAECMYKGPYAEMVPAYDAMNKWVSEKGLIATGTAYEVYYNSPVEVTESELLTKIMFPVK